MGYPKPMVQACPKDQVVDAVLQLGGWFNLLVQSKINNWITDMLLLRHCPMSCELVHFRTKGLFSPMLDCLVISPNRFNKSQK